MTTALTELLTEGRNQTTIETKYKKIEILSPVLMKSDAFCD